MPRYCRIVLSSFVLTILASQLPARGDGGDQKEPEQKELERLQGTWEVVSAELNGRDSTHDYKQLGLKITFKNNVWITTESIGPLRDTADSCLIKLSPSDSPKQFDRVVIHVADGMTDRTVMRGIYELTGDSLKMCINMPGANRPTNFSSIPSNGYFSAVFTRVKP